MAKKVSYAAMLVALAMIFSYVEALVPISFGIPGIKLGLANLVVVRWWYESCYHHLCSEVFFP